MEKDPNPFPKFDLFPRLCRVAGFVKEVLRLDGQVPYSGGAALLDRELYDNPDQLEFDYGAHEQTL